MSVTKKTKQRRSLKRTRIAQNLGKGMNVSEASRAAGYAHRQSGHRALKRMREYLPEILERIDLPVEKALMKLGQQLEAKETKFFAHEGRIISTRTVNDNAIQQSAAVQIARIYGCYPGNSAIDEGNGDARAGSIHLTLVFGSEQGLKEFQATLGDKQTLDDPQRQHEPQQCRSRPFGQADRILDVSTGKEQKPSRPLEEPGE